MSGLNASESGTEKNQKNQPVLQRKFTLLNARETWFISPSDGQAVNVDPQATGGASDAQWVSFVRTYVRLKDEQASQHWGVMARCDFLNWLSERGRRKPVIFASKREALASLKKNSFDSGPQTEMETSSEPKITEKNEAENEA